MVAVVKLHTAAHGWPSTQPEGRAQMVVVYGFKDSGTVVTTVVGVGVGVKVTVSGLQVAAQMLPSGQGSQTVTG